MITPINDFSDCLEFGNEKEFIEKMDTEYYPRKFKLASIRRFNKDTLKDRDMQKNGIDIEVLLTNGKKIHIDEKRRKQRYADVLIEIGMDYQMSGIITPGWLLSERKKPDYIIYAVPAYSLPIPPGNIYKLPFEALQNIFKNSFEILITEYNEYFYKKNINLDLAKNWGYNKNLRIAQTFKNNQLAWWTLNKPVKTIELFEMLKKESEDLIPSI